MQRQINKSFYQNLPKQTNSPHSLISAQSLAYRGDQLHFPGLMDKKTGHDYSKNKSCPAIFTLDAISLFAGFIFRRTAG